MSTSGYVSERILDLLYVLECNSDGIFDELDFWVGGRNGSNLLNNSWRKMVSKEEKLRLSSDDFMGLNFADKKLGRGLAAGLVPLLDPFPDRDLPEVEIIVGDKSRFENAITMKPEPAQDEIINLYKPKALKEGDSLMDTGNLEDAILWYKKVMDKLPFQVMYEKLQSQPSAEMSKKASQFMFSFRAMEVMKVRGSNLSLGNTGYQN
ncbi:hypothetical protein HS088_TW21G01467 [Tripterygium wilfordii]|uniref:Uncharacterized protein n=1 Tax=Tripterygium wilfordii TaxID=458696 RepID=A0A7J7C5A5_TRIWF|nr:hypothetical protein HS088_TW21G01467 [Tripterygium wilfordii]